MRLAIADPPYPPFIGSGGRGMNPDQSGRTASRSEGTEMSGQRQRWIVEHYGQPDYSDYPTWMPLDSTYYDTEQDAQEACDALVEDRYQRHVESHKRDVRECAERAAVYEKATAAVEGMPQAHILGRGYRTVPIKEPHPSQYAALYRVARVTSFQERVQALLDSTRGEVVDVDDLRDCFKESTDA